MSRLWFPKFPAARVPTFYYRFLGAVSILPCTDMGKPFDLFFKEASAIEANNITNTLVLVNDQNVSSPPLSFYRPY